MTPRELADRLRRIAGYLTNEEFKRRDALEAADLLEKYADYVELTEKAELCDRLAAGARDAAQKEAP